MNIPFDYLNVNRNKLSIFTYLLNLTIPVMGIFYKFNVSVHV